MKKTAAIIAVTALALLAPLPVFATDHESMKMEHGGHSGQMGNVAHEEVVDGVKATFTLIGMTGTKETHHLMVSFKDVKTGKVFADGAVTVKIQAPDKSEQVKELMGMGGMAGMDAGFGANFDMANKGKYGVMTKFKLKDGKVRTAKFWYTVK
jgi:hypothetical protein